MAKRKEKRKDKTIPTLDDVVLNKIQKENKVEPEVKKTEQEDSTKTEKPDPEKTKTEEKPVDKKQDSAEPKKENQQKEKETSTDETQIYTRTDAEADTEETSRRVEDRRVEDVPLHSGESDRRVSQRRKTGSRASDRVINAQLDPLIEKILKEMIPDIGEHIETKLGTKIKDIVSNIMPELEQHMRMQLRFEIDKHMSKILKAGIHPEDED